MNFLIFIFIFAGIWKATYISANDCLYKSPNMFPIKMNYLHFINKYEDRRRISGGK